MEARSRVLGSKNARHLLPPSELINELVKEADLLHQRVFDLFHPYATNHPERHRENSSVIRHASRYHARRSVRAEQGDAELDWDLHAQMVHRWLRARSRPGKLAELLSPPASPPCSDLLPDRDPRRPTASHIGTTPPAILSYVHTDVGSATLRWDGELYAAAFPFPGLEDWDCRVYGALASALGGPTLELGTGTARILGALLGSGADAYGLECDATMADYGRRRLRALGLGSMQARLTVEDMRCFDHPRRYRLIMLPDNSLPGLHDDGDVLDMLAAVSRHLAPGGEFVFDQQRLDQVTSTQTWPARTITVRGARHELRTSTSYDQQTHKLSLRLEVAGPARNDEMVLRLQHRSRARIEHLLLEAGFVPRAPAIDERGRPVGRESAFYIGRFQRVA